MVLLIFLRCDLCLKLRSFKLLSWPALSAPREMSWTTRPEGTVHDRELRLIRSSAFTGRAIDFSIMSQSLGGFGGEPTISCELFWSYRCTTCITRESRVHVLDSTSPDIEAERIQQKVASNVHAHSTVFDRAFRVPSLKIYADCLRIF